MSIELFDSHAHLDAKDFAGEQAQIIDRAQQAGVTRILTVGAGYGIESAVRAIKLAEEFPTVWASAGIHPHDAAVPFKPEMILDLARHPRVVAIGETGLDFYRDWSPRELQYQWFEANVEIAKKLQKPLIIHSRSAGSECFELLKRLSAQDVGGVFHCYAEDVEFARKLASINFLVSFPGTLTFKKADALREIAKQIPLEQIMIETDSPYMAPEPNRGKRCEPAYVRETAQMLAKLKNLPFEELARHTTATALKFFKISA